MTPLAQHLLNDWCVPIKDRTIADISGVLPLMMSAKCFECSAIGPFLGDLVGTTLGDLLDSGRIFAPAPVTFLEWNVSGKRVGFLIKEVSEGHIKVYGATKVALFEVGAIHNGELWVCEPQCEILMRTLIPVLFLINTPRCLGNITHLPHLGLQRKIAARMGATGKFPLLAWTEITLWINPVGVEAENREIEAHLSGQKCLHFVRAFLRWRLQKWELVKAHWRGDGSKGIKRSRYKLAA